VISRRDFLGVAVAAVAATTIACEPPADRAIDPAWGKQPCGHCMMLLQDRAAAAELVTPSGERMFFDDVGCMVSWIDEHHVEPAHAWVRGPGGSGWVEAHATRYAPGARTPMDYGFVASASGSEARDAVSFDEMASHVRRKNDDATKRNHP
jgi:hypothetical protein